jgi:voltage-gated potassium channel
MTIITVSTIGYTEVVDLTNNVPGRVFTIFIALGGIGVLTYSLSNVASLIIEGNIRQSIKKKKMEKKIGHFTDHYILCGIGNLGNNILEELHKTKRTFVIADKNPDKISLLAEKYDQLNSLTGDCTEESFLLKLGIEKAKGIFVCTGDDNINLVVCVAAKHVNPNVYIVVECNEVKNIEKLRIVKADKVISPTFIGGLRMASEMVRPTVTTFLDEMMRDQEKNLRIEEIKFSTKYQGRSLMDIDFEHLPNTIPMAIREKDKWVFNPPKRSVITEHSILIVMTNPIERKKMDEIYS